jgi:hypothetical protein
MSVNVTSSDFPEIRWKAHWIWVPEDKLEMQLSLPGEEGPSRKESHGLFRKGFSLSSVPARAPARITADSRYVLYVNGKEAYRGPIRSQPRRMHYDLFDLAPYLKTGENIIAVYVKFFGRPLSMYIPPVANMGLGQTGMVVFEANLGEGGWLVSDASWRASKSNAWLVDQFVGNDVIGSGVPFELLDARRLPTGWQSAGFDDSSWGNAHLLRSIHIGGFARTQPPADPYGPLYPRPIAALGGEVIKPFNIRLERIQGLVEISQPNPVARVADTLGLPVVSPAEIVKFPLSLDVQEGNMARLVVDMGRIVSGLVQLDVSAPEGTEFELAYVEDPLQIKATQFGSQQSGSRYITRGKDDRFEVFDSNGLRYIYVLIHGATGSMTINSLAVREHIYPWQAGASFECSDPELNKIFTAGVRTVNLNSHDAFVDCPTREQRAWVGDSVVHQMVHLATNLDWRLAWHYLTLGNSPRYDGILPMSVAGEIEASGAITIPDWSLHWVHGVYNFYRFQGDKEKVKSFMPTIEHILRWYTPYQTAAGVLKDVVEWNLVDWGSLFVEDTSSILTAIWARGLHEFVEMAQWLGEKSSQEWAEGLYARAKSGYEVFWDEARGTYVDHIKNGVQQKPISQVAGALAVVSYLAPKERWARIVETITDPQKLVVRSWTGGDKGEYSPEKMMNQMMGIYVPDWDTENQIVIGQPFISYLVHDAVAQAGLAGKLTELYRRWSQFLLGGYDTIGECWGWGTHVHGWSCTPTRDMVFYTLGVTPLEPGYSMARIAPRLGGLAWAKGCVPTPHGMITVNATTTKVTIDSPVPVRIDLENEPSQVLPAGHHEL